MPIWNVLTIYFFVNHVIIHFVQIVIFLQLNHVTIFIHYVQICYVFIIYFFCVISGGKTVFPHILSTTPQMLQNPDWKWRHAALMAISATGEGCHKQMVTYLDQIMNGVLNYINDPHPRVRFACCNALGQMSTDFAPIFEKKFHGKVVPGLLHLMDDNANPRVQAHAGAALVNFSEDCPKNILAPYLDAIIGNLH